MPLCHKFSRTFKLLMLVMISTCYVAATIGHGNYAYQLHTVYIINIGQISAFTHCYDPTHRGFYCDTSIKDGTISLHDLLFSLQPLERCVWL